jgi:hypothetical protein
MIARTSLVPTILFFLAIAAPYPIDLVLAAREVELPGRPPREEVGAIVVDDIWAGTAGTKFDDQLQNESYVGRWITGRHNEFVHRLIGRSPPVNWAGEDDWLFVPRNARELSDETFERVIADDVEVIAAVDERVRAAGARLVVAIVPDRERVYADKAYWNDEMPRNRAAFLPELVARLREQGIATVDLTDALVEAKDAETEPFFSDDHHFTSSGAQASAKAIAAALPDDIRSELDERATEPPFRVRWNEKGSHKHSLIKNMGFVPGSDYEVQFRDQEPRAQFREKKGAGKSCATYWSTSFANYGSPQFFANEIRCPVRIIFRAGQGSDWAPLRDLPKLRRHAHPVVWEIPEYHLLGQDGGLASAMVEIRYALLNPG